MQLVERVRHLVERDRLRHETGEIEPAVERSLREKRKVLLGDRIAAVRDGEEVIICQAGKPVARLMAYEPARKKPRLGTGKGKIILKPGWDSPETDAEIEELMLGEGEGKAK